MEKRACLNATDALSAAACLDWAAEDNERAVERVGPGAYADALEKTGRAWRRIAMQLRAQTLKTENQD